jgi:hypothetical protein
MRRLFWMGVGAAGAVLAAQRLRAAWHRYTPEGVAEQVEQAGQGVLDAGRSALGTFRASFAERQRALVDQLLVEPEGGDPAALRRARGPATAPSAPRSSAVPSGRVDDEDDLFDV